MIKVALYARYSSDNQSVARSTISSASAEHVAREKRKVAGTYHDTAMSGASVFLRLFDRPAQT